MRAVVFAAGEGKRIRPLSIQRPKPLLPIAGEPLIEQIIKNLVYVGIRKIGVVVGYGEEQVRKALEGKTEAEITFIEQKTQRGTADALAACRRFLNGEEHFLVVYGDITITKEALKKIIDYYGSNELDGAILTVKLSHGERFGVVEKTDNGLLREIHEKKEHSRGLVNSGVYILPNETLEVVEKLPLSPRGEYELTDALNILARHGRKIGVLEDDGEWWFDIGRPADYLRANLYTLERKLINKPLIKPTASLGKDTKIKGSCLICDNVKIGDGVKIIGPTVIGEGVEIGRNSTISLSVVLEEAKIGEGVVLNQAIVGEKARVEQHTLTDNSNDIFPKLIVAPTAYLPKGAEIKSGTIIS